MKSTWSGSAAPCNAYGAALPLHTLSMEWHCRSIQCLWSGNAAAVIWARNVPRNLKSQATNGLGTERQKPLRDF